MTNDPTRLTERARAALDEVVALRAAVAREGRAAYRLWEHRIERPGFAPSALNLAQYLAVRRRDLRLLQRRLMSLGISSLGRLEGRVLASLDSVAVALAALGDAEAGLRPPTERQFFRGETRLFANADATLGPAAAGRSGRILVTLPSEAADDPQVIADLVRRGTDAVRINCAHDGPKQWAKMVANARAARTRAGTPPRVLMDIAGPKVRTGARGDAAGPQPGLRRRHDPAGPRHPAAAARDAVPDDLHGAARCSTVSRPARRSRSTTARCTGSWWRRRPAGSWCGSRAASSAGSSSGPRRA